MFYILQWYKDEFMGVLEQFNNDEQALKIATALNESSEEYTYTVLSKYDYEKMKMA